MPSLLRTLLRIGLALGALLALLVIGVLVDAWESFGGRADGARRARMEASPQWGDGAFRNATPMWNDVAGSVFSLGEASPYAEAEAPVPVVPGDRSRFAQAPETGLRVTWLGHSTLFIEVDGHRFLTDPVFGGRASPVDWAGPKPWYAPPIPLGELPVPDAVLISHDHYDHLQMSTIRAMATWDTTFIVPLGVGAHLEAWGVPTEHIAEHDWWETERFGAVTVTLTPARHASGRQVFDQMGTLWGGYALVGPEHRVYFSGDTGLFDELADIGEQLGPFDVTMFEAGAYARYWPDWHLGPENAVRAHELVRGEVLLPIHWGLWNLAMHGWTEPAERTLAEVARRGARAYLPKPGESFEPERLPAMDRWWPELPWETVAQTPIQPTGLRAETLRRP